MADIFIICVNKDGKFLKEESDGHATWLSWTDDILLADRFGEHFTYGERRKHTEFNDPLPAPEYFKKWPAVPSGCSMLWCRLEYNAYITDRKPNA